MSNPASAQYCPKAALPLNGVTPSERDGHSSTQSSHRLLAYSDALISIIATVMILPVAHTKVQDNEVGKCPIIYFEY
uniref:Endosomal/lysosomal potassium channel TMEM175 n=1 Tax=Hucho hucho TaxID=62062 RepID=A0A4W5PEG7_9TELE